MNEPIILALPYPVSANRYWATRVYRVKGTNTHRAMTYRTPEAVAYCAHVAQIAMLAGLPEPFTGRVALSYRLYPNRPQDWEKRVRKLGAEWDDDVMCMDLGNAQKVMEDALQGIAYVNDKQVRKLVAERCEPDEYGARLIVYVRAIPKEIVQESLL